MSEIKQWKLPPSFATAIKNCLDITKATYITLSFNQGTCTVTSFLNYFGASIDIPVQGTENDKFDVVGDSILKAIGDNKKGNDIDLAREVGKNTIQFKIGTFRGELPTANSSIKPLIRIEQDSEVQSMSPGFKTALFSTFDKFKINSKKVNIDMLNLQMTCKNGHLLYLIGDPDYWAWYEDENSGLEDFDSRISLKYMLQIEKNFKNNPDFKIGLNSGVIVVEGDSCILNFPQISFETAPLTLEDLKQYKADYFSGEPKGMFLCDSGDVSNFMKRAINLFQDDASANLLVCYTDTLNCKLQSVYGNANDSFAAKAKGEVDFHIDAFNIQDCLSKLSGTIKVALYDACILLSSKENPKLKYMFSYTA